MALVRRLGHGDTDTCEGVLQAEEQRHAGAGSGGPAKKRNKKPADVFLDEMQHITSMVFAPPVGDEAVPVPARLLVTSVWSTSSRDGESLEGTATNTETMQAAMRGRNAHVYCRAIWYAAEHATFPLLVSQH